MQPLLDGPALQLVHGRERTAPEDLPDHGRVLDERLFLRREPIEPRGDDPLHGLGERGAVRRGHAPLGDHARVLLGVERIPAGLGEERRLHLGGHDGLLEEAAEQPGDLIFRKR